MSEKKTAVNSEIPMANPAQPAPSIARDKREQVEKQLFEMREKDKKPVRGLFKFHETPGGLFSFVYRKYKQDNVERYDLWDGQVYTIPLGVAKHINNDCAYPVHKYLENEDGKKQVVVEKKVQRVSFQSLEFTDMDSQQLNEPANLVTVQSVYY